MPIRIIPLEKEVYYHVYNRGFNKESIFNQPQDYERFLWKIGEYSKLYHVSVFAWALMPNHFHMLIRAKKSEVRTPVTDFMLKLQQSHAMYFKLKYGKSGLIFQGRFCAKAVESEGYLRQVLHYIHRQPSHHSLGNDEDWNYTSLHLFKSGLVPSPDLPISISPTEYYRDFLQFKDSIQLDSTLEFDKM
jgi:REP element-mobilizing transposase RayT